jgi:hypothetical protein
MIVADCNQLRRRWWLQGGGHGHPHGDLVRVWGWKNRFFVSFG